MRRRILVSGAAGRVARLIIPGLSRDYDLKLTDQRTSGPEHAEVTLAKLEDPGPWTELCQGIDTVLHLGAVARDTDDWPALYRANVLGVRHVLAAAQAAGCRRVVLMSSVLTMAGHRHRPIVETDPPCPTGRYAATKVYAEALGQAYAAHRGLSVICIRLGGVYELHDARLRPDFRDLDLTISVPDLLRLLHRCIETSRSFDIVNGVSRNTGGRFGLQHAASLGFWPEDDLVQHASRHCRGAARRWLRNVKRRVGRAAAMLKSGA